MSAKLTFLVFIPTVITLTVIAYFGINAFVLEPFAEIQIRGDPQRDEFWKSRWVYGDIQRFNKTANSCKEGFVELWDTGYSFSCYTPDEAFDDCMRSYPQEYKLVNGDVYKRDIKIHEEIGEGRVTCGTFYSEGIPFSENEIDLLDRLNQKNDEELKIEMKFSIDTIIQLTKNHPDLLTDDEVDILLSMAVGKGYAMIDPEVDTEASRILMKVIDVLSDEK